MDYRTHRRGFAVDDNGSRYGKRGHELGATRQWTADEARYWAAQRWTAEKKDDDKRPRQAAAT